MGGVGRDDPEVRRGGRAGPHAGAVGPELLQGGGEAPPLKGAPFLASWKGKTAGDLYAFIHQAMPPGAGGSLSDGDYRAVTAYILQANGTKDGARIGD